MLVFQVFQNLPKKANKAENTETINLILKLKNIEILPTTMYIEHSALCVQCTFNPKWVVD